MPNQCRAQHCMMALFTLFYDYFAECEREFTRLVDRSLLPSLDRKRLFAFPLTKAQLDEEKNVVEWFGNCET